MEKKKVVELVCGGSVINRAYPVLFAILAMFDLLKVSSYVPDCCVPTASPTVPDCPAGRGPGGRGRQVRSHPHFSQETAPLSPVCQNKVILLELVKLRIIGRLSDQSPRCHHS